jgi:predicted membrane-bound mannosyltransferase
MKFPFMSILTLILITLKLIGQIDWSWWWVLAPMYIPALIGLAAAIYLWGKDNG